MCSANGKERRARPGGRATPRTDAECENNGIGLPLRRVDADFARKLELELIECRTSLAAIHYHSGRKVSWLADAEIIMASIHTEAESRIPELAHIVPN